MPFPMSSVIILIIMRVMSRLYRLSVPYFHSFRGGIVDIEVPEILSWIIFGDDVMRTVP